MLLFIKANGWKLQKVLEYLNLFCDVSRQKVSVSKTRMFFSERVSGYLAKLLNCKNAFVIINDLDKYL